MKLLLQIFIFAFALLSGVKGQSPYILCLGVVQDGGYPHLGCEKDCCNKVWKDHSLKRYIVSLALVDPQSKNWWLFEATPDLKEQFQYFKTITNGQYHYLPSGIFLSHAHIGHYTGLSQLGREVLNTKEVAVYVLPKMKKYLESNGPWSQLVNLKNIKLVQLDTINEFTLEKGIGIKTFTVPHRDEFSETAGFKINVNTGVKNDSSKAYLFIPDIDKWEKWNKSIIEEVKMVNYAFIDATFSEITELKNRNVEEVPHPFVFETISKFANESQETKSKIQFIHFNHTNPILWDNAARQNVLKKGFGIAEQGKKY
jgi:pyrroloquinoline quinone biosynthesis protein B